MNEIINEIITIRPDRAQQDHRERAARLGRWKEAVAIFEAVLARQPGEPQVVVNHAVAVHDRIARLNALWPELVQRYDKQVETELRCREALLRHYEAVVYGK